MADQQQNQDVTLEVVYSAQRASPHRISSNCSVFFWQGRWCGLSLCESEAGHNFNTAPYKDSIEGEAICYKDLRDGWRAALNEKEYTDCDIIKTMIDAVPIVAKTIDYFFQNVYSDFFPPTAFLVAMRPGVGRDVVVEILQRDMLAASKH